jgi:hypothetical protein
MISRGYARFPLIHPWRPPTDAELERLDGIFCRFAGKCSKWPSAAKLMDLEWWLVARWGGRLMEDEGPNDGYYVLQDVSTMPYLLYVVEEYLEDDAWEAAPSPLHVFAVGDDAILDFMTFYAERREAERREV